MHQNYFILVILACLAISANANDHDSKAKVFTKETFDADVTQTRLFVMFFAPWCGHCKRLAPTWGDLAEELNVADSGVIVGQVDCTVEKDLCAAHGVRGYPTVKFFNLNAEGEKYARSRTIESLREFVQEQLGKAPEPAVEEEVKQEEEKKEVEAAAANEAGVYDLTDANFGDHIATGHTFVKFFAPWCGHCKRLAPTWDELASIYKDNKKVTIAKVDCTAQKETCSKFSIRGYPTLQWFTDGQKSSDYRQGRSLQDMSTFVNQMTATENEEAKKSVDGKIPDDRDSLVVALTAEDFKDTISEDYTVVAFDPTSELKTIIEAAAKSMVDNDEIMFATVDCGEYKDLCERELVSGPAIKFYKDGVKQGTYQGTADAIKLKEFAERMMKVEAKRDEL